jgi:hypothetical protein
MGITPEAVAGREFEFVRRGFDPEAVTAFQRGVAKELARRDARIAHLERQLEMARRAGRAATYQNVGEEVAAVLTQAQIAAERIETKASFDSQMAVRRLRSATRELANVHKALGEHLSALSRITSPTAAGGAEGAEFEDEVPPASRPSRRRHLRAAVVDDHDDDWGEPEVLVTPSP